MNNYEGRLYWDGEKPLIQTNQKFIKWLEQFPEDQWFTFDVSPLGLEACHQQKLYFKWRDILAVELGYDSQDLHRHLKFAYNNNKTTKGMSTEEWSTFISKVLAFAGSNNISLPTG